MAYTAVICKFLPSAYSLSASLSETQTFATLILSLRSDDFTARLSSLTYFIGETCMQKLKIVNQVKIAYNSEIS